MNMMMTSEKKIYVTTERAGFVVAGRRIPSVYSEGKEPTPAVGFELELTEDEAAYELSQGTIELKKASPVAKKTAPEAA